MTLDTYYSRINKGGQGRITLNEGHILGGVNARFKTIPEAVAFMSVRLSTGWQLTMPTDPDVRAKVLISNAEIGKTVLNILKPQHFRPNYQNFMSGVLAGEIKLAAKVEEPSSELLDGGLAVVNLREETFSELTFIVQKEHGYSEKELLARLEAVPPKVAAFLNGVLAGQVEPPYGLRPDERSLVPLVFT